MVVFNLNDWLNAHETEIENLGIENVMDACEQATNEHHRKEFFEEYYEDVKSELGSYKSEKAIQQTLEQRFNEQRVPDDYFPLWNYAWEFPASYTPVELNNYDVSGLVFFEVRQITYVSLSTCGMDMTPSLETGYLLYSDLNLDKKYVENKVLKEPSYFSYVVGQRHFADVCHALGLTQDTVKHAEEQVKQRLGEFNRSLDSISKLRDKGQISQHEASLLGLLTYLKYDKK